MGACQLGGQVFTFAGAGPAQGRASEAGRNGGYGTRGCIVLERPGLVKQLTEKHGAKDTTQRQTAMAELESMTTRSSQWIKEEIIGEKHWMYWLAKRFFYQDFGVYAKLAK